MLAWIRGILAKPTQPAGPALAEAHATTKKAEVASAMVSETPGFAASQPDAPHDATTPVPRPGERNRIANPPRVDPRFFVSDATPPADGTSEPDVFSLRLRVRMPVEDQPSSPAPALCPPAPALRPGRGRRPAPPWRSRRPLPDHVSLRDARLGSSAQRAHLAALGIESVGDLLREPSMHLRRAGLSRRAIQTVDAWRDAVRLQREVTPLRLCDARLLVAIHRRSPQDLARSKPARLTLELQRFAWSSQGQRLLGKRPLPTRAHAERWINSARACQPNDLDG